MVYFDFNEKAIEKVKQRQAEVAYKSIEILEGRFELSEFMEKVRIFDPSEFPSEPSEINSYGLAELGFLANFYFNPNLEDQIISNNQNIFGE